MRNVRNWIILFTAMAAVLSFTAGPAFAQGFTIDFSSATGFGVSDPEKLQTNNVIVNLTNPLTGTLTIPVNLVWKFNYTTLALEIEGAQATTDTTDPNACDALPSLTVNVTNALTGDAIEGATVQAESQSANTNASGEATLTGLPVSSFPVTVSADGFVGVNQTASLECGDQESIGVSLLPADDQGTIDGDIRIILTWGVDPIDLDSHCTKYEEGGNGGQSPFPNPEAEELAFHIYWNNRSEAGVPVELDVDDVSSFGPETITIRKVDGAFEPGTYRYSVHHYDGSSNIPESGASVKVYQGDTVMGTYNPPSAGDANPGDNWAWRVFDIDIDEDGNVAFNTTGEYYGPVLSSQVD